jgi:2-polyprenyl-6-methoxyphenol hydroxylase-like FAD-dependent oxidoreductase
VTLTGILGDRPPTDPKGFEDFARSLRFPDVYEAIRDGKPLEDAVAFQYPANVRNRYERLSDFPDGLLVLGDAVCAFDPIYGQGMSSAALQAEALQAVLAGAEPLTWQRYFRAIAGAIEAPWQISSGGDLAFPGVTGRRTATVRIVNAYLPRLHAVAAKDAELSKAFVRVTGLLDPPQSLLRPAIALRVLTGKRAAPVR